MKTLNKKEFQLNIGDCDKKRFLQIVFLQLKNRKISLENISKKFNISVKELSEIFDYQIKNPRKYLGLIEKPYPVKLKKRLKELSNNNIGGRERTREIVRFRDNYTCQSCGIVRTPEMARQQGKKQLDVHHLDGLCGKKTMDYDSVYSVYGLITLCHKCHFNHPEHTLKTRKK